MSRQREKIHEPLFVVEKRDALGRLRFDGGMEPPDSWIQGVTQDVMAKWYYARHPGNHLVDMAAIYAYMWEEFGWQVRPKTW